MPGNGGTSASSGPTVAAIAASRAAASSGSGTQITLPSSIEKPIAPCAWGRRSSSYVSSSASVARPVSTRSSFHARFAASRRPAHIPCPANGGIWWAASPASRTRPRRHCAA